MNIGFAFTGSFCTHAAVLVALENIVVSGHHVIPIFSPATAVTDTRFGTAAALKERVMSITGSEPLVSQVEAEPLGPKGLIDLLIVAPCTGNTLAKMANAITDTSVTMVAKSLSRNNKPVVIALSTNDALGLNFKNIATLMNAKNFYFVPFRQDDPEKKPKSLMSDLALLEKTVQFAALGKQLQPVLV